jgi:hypothetical protein
VEVNGARERRLEVERIAGVGRELGAQRDPTEIAARGDQERRWRYRRACHAHAWRASAALVALVGCGGTSTGGSNDSGTQGRDASLAPHCASTPTKLVDPADFLGAGLGLPTGSGVSVAINVAVSGSDIFYVLGIQQNLEQNATIMRVSSAGGAPSLVATVADPFSPERIVATPGALFYQVSNDATDGGFVRTLLRVVPGGGPPSPIAHLDGSVAPETWFASDGQNLYYVDDDGTERTPLAGGAIQKIASQRGDLAVVGGNVVIVDGPTGNVYAIPSAGGASTLLAPGQTNANRPFACGDDVCWLTGGQASPSGADFIQPADGGLPVFDCGPLDEACVFWGLVRLRANARPATVLASRGYAPVDILFDGSDFYFSVGGDASPGGIGKIGGAGGLPVGLEEGYGFAVDDACLYWANLDGVFSVAKSAAPGTRPRGGRTARELRAGRCGHLAVRYRPGVRHPGCGAGWLHGVFAT